MKRRPRNKAARYRSFARRGLIFAIILSVGLLFTWTYIRSALLSVLIGVSRGESGTLADSVSGEAVFAGGISIVTAPAPGAVNFLVRSGESVRLGQPIAEVGTPSTAAAFLESIAFAEKALVDYERATENEFASLLSRVQPAYEKSVQLFFTIQEDYAAGETASARAAEVSLASVGSSISADRERLLEIEAERSRLAANIASIAAAQKASTVQVLAPASGTFVTDFCEIDSKFTEEALASKDASELLALAREAKDARPRTVKEGQAVSTGDVLGRVVFGQKVVFYLPIKTEDRPDLAGGREVDITFTTTGERESGVITRVEDGKPPGYSIVAGEMPLVSVAKMVRSGAVSLVIRSRSGVIVPKSAILEREGKTGVLTIQKTYARFVPVEVLMTLGDKAVVRGISAGDEVVSRALGFLEGKRVR